MKSYWLIVLLFEIPTWAGNVQTTSLSKAEKLVEAVKTKDDALIDKLQEEDSKFNLIEKKEASILHWAVAIGSKQVLQYVLGKIKEKRGAPTLLEYVRYKIEVAVLLDSIQNEYPVDELLVAWSPDGSMVCTGDSGYLMKVWNVVERKVVGAFRHGGSVIKVAWSPDGRMVSATGFYATQVWDVVERKVVASIQHTGAAWGAVWDGNKLYIYGNEQSQVWDMVRRKVDQIDWEVNNKIQETVRARDKKEKEIIWTTKEGVSFEVHEWNPDKTKFCTGKMPSGYMDKSFQVYARGGTVLDWLVSTVCAGGEKDALKVLLALDEYANLAGKCSEVLLVNLCHAASKVKEYQPDKYKRLCEVIEMIANKQGAPL